MRDYGKIYTRFWTSPDISDLSAQAKLIAVYLLSSPHTTMIGCFRIPLAYIVDDIGIPSETVSEGMRELSERGFLTLDERNSIVFITSFLRWNLIENPNQGKAAAKLADQIPQSSSVYGLLIGSLSLNGKNLPKGFIDGFETLSKPGTGEEAESGTGPGPGIDSSPTTISVMNIGKPSVPVATLPLNDGSNYFIFGQEVKKYAELYQAVDIFQELKNMTGWLLANPRNRKTRSGIDRFVNSWLANAQNGAKLTGGINESSGNSFANKSQHRSNGNMESLASVLADRPHSGVSGHNGRNAPSDSEQRDPEGLLDASRCGIQI